MKKIALVLSGCGHQDGAEITESVSLIIGLSALGAQISYFAPDVQFHPQNHVTKTIDSDSSRNAMIEAARITRGKIQNLSELKSQDFDALTFAGGFGAALRLSNWAEKGAQCEVHPEVQRIIKEFHSGSKPIGAVCIAPILVAKVLGRDGVTITLGNSADAIQEVKKTGAHHEICPVHDFITDRDFKVITTPAYMHDAKPHEVFQGISGLCKELMDMA